MSELPGSQQQLPEEYALIQVLSAALGHERVTQKVNRSFMAGRTMVVETQVPAPGFMGTLAEGILVPEMDAERIRQVMQDALQRSGALAEGDYAITQAEAPDWAQKQGKVRLKVDVHDFSRMDMEAAASFIEAEACGSNTMKLVAQAVRNQAALAQPAG